MTPLITVSYRAYPFSKDGRDPILDDTVETIEKEKFDKKKKIGMVSTLTGLARGTVANIVNGKTRFPRHSTIENIFASLGYTTKRERNSRFDLEAEMKDAKRWLVRRKAAKLAAEERLKEQRRERRRNGDKNNSASH